MVNVKVMIVSSICGKTAGSAVSVSACDEADLSKRIATPFPEGLKHFLKIERDSIPMADVPDEQKEEEAAKELLSLVGAEVPSNWSVETTAKYKDHIWVNGGWGNPGGGFGFAFVLQQRIPGSDFNYMPMQSEVFVDTHPMTVEFLAVVQKV